MQSLSVLREKHGSVYVTELPDGRLIPWKPLTIGQYLEYDQLSKRGIYPNGYIENEIFRKCVLDGYLLSIIDQLKAGIVSTIVGQIMLASSPATTGHLQSLFEVKRLETSGIIHQIVTIILRAFPAYTPEQVYAMDYERLIERLALAEKKLLETGLLNSPLVLQTDEPSPVQAPRAKQVEPESKMKAKEMLAAYMQQQGITDMPEIPDIPAATGKQTIIQASDMNDIIPNSVNEEVETQMVREAKAIYADYIDQMKKGEKVRIKTPEEREEETRAKLIENQKKVAQALAKKKMQEKREEERAARLLAKAKRKKRR